MEWINGRETLFNPIDTYCVFVDITFRGSILPNLPADANQTTHSPPARE
jgi:hypothetical protein